MYLFVIMVTYYIANNLLVLIKILHLKNKGHVIIFHNCRNSSLSTGIVNKIQR